EIRPPSAYWAARGGRSDTGGGSAGIRYYRSCPRPGRAQRPYGRPARALPNPVEEFCGPGDRAYFQRSRWELVDRLAWPPYEISSTRRASRASITQPLYRAVSRPIKTALARVKPADERPLDLLHDRWAADRKEPRDADFQNHA